MDEITLGQMRNFLLWVIAFGTAIITVVRAVKKAVNSAFEPMNKKIDALQESLTKQIEQVDQNATKNYLVQTLAQIDRNGEIDGVSKARLYEQYEHYVKQGGNSYVKDEFERLKKKNIL